MLSSVLRMCTGKHYFTEALQVRELCQAEVERIEDKTVWSCLLFCAVETSEHEACLAFFKRIQAIGAPSARDYGNMVRVSAAKARWEEALRLLREMKEADVRPDAVVYNTALAACVQAKQVEQAARLLDEMEAAEPCLAD